MTDLGLLPYNLTRARIRTRSNSNFIFLLSQVSHHLLSNRSFTLKQPVGFTKTTRHFHQNYPSLSTKRPVTFPSNWSQTPKKKQQNLKLYLKSTVTHSKSNHCTRRCDTCDSKKAKTPVTRAYAWGGRKTFFGIHFLAYDAETSILYFWIIFGITFASRLPGILHNYLARLPWFSFSSIAILSHSTTEKDEKQ